MQESIGDIAYLFFVIKVASVLAAGKFPGLPYPK